MREILSMDRRQKKTREAVFRAFEQLLEKKKYEHITVQDIIDTANIGRSTFYANFETKDALLNELCAEIFDHIFLHDLLPEESENASSHEVLIRHRLIHLLRHLERSGNILGRIIRSDSREIFLRYFRSCLAGMFSSLAVIPAGVPEEYVINNCVCCFTETVVWWFSEKTEYSPEQIVGFFLATNAALFEPAGAAE